MEVFKTKITPKERCSIIINGRFHLEITARGGVVFHLARTPKRFTVVCLQKLKCKAHSYCGETLGVGKYFVFLK